MNEASLLILRLYFGGMMAFSHGWPKLMGYSTQAATFPDPLGVGNEVSAALAIFGELICGVLVAVGLFTRFATIPLIITMAVAALIIHANDPFYKQEFPLTYLAAYVVIFMSGSGKYSLQQMFGITSNSRWKIISFLMK